MRAAFSRHRSGSVSAALAVLGAALLSGCGGTDTLAVAQAASAKTFAAHSAHLRMSISGRGLGTTADGQVLFAEGDFSFADRSGSMQMKVPGAAGSMLGTMQVVELDDVIYERLPAALAAQVHSKPWVKLDLNDLKNLTGVDIGGLTQGQSSDPAQILDQLAGVAAPVRKLGSTTIDGARVTHYSAVIDLRRAARKAPARRAAALDSLRKMLGIDSYPIELWVDGAGRLRRMTYTVDLSHATVRTPAQPGGTQPLRGSETVTLDLSHFGVAVSVTAPPPDQVTDLATLLGRGRVPTTSAAGTGSAATLWARALADARAAGWVHVETTARQGGHAVTFSDDAGPTEGTQYIVVDGGHAELRLTGGVVYVRADTTAFVKFLGFPASAASRYAGRWIVVRPSDQPYGTEAEGVTLPSVLRSIAFTPSGAPGAPVTLGGQTLIPISGTFEGDNGGRGIIYVTQGARPLPVRAVGVAKDGSTDTIVFSRWGTPVTVVPPPSPVPFAQVSASGSA